MKNTFAQCRELISGKRRLLALKKALLRKCSQRNIFESWKDHSATTSLGCDFDITHI